MALILTSQAVCSLGVTVKVDIRRKAFCQYINVSYLPRTTVRTNRVDPITVTPLDSVVVRKQKHPRSPLQKKSFEPWEDDFRLQ